MNENSKPMIALDAMGGDHGPSVIVPGSVAGMTADSPYGITLYGDEKAIGDELSKLDTASKKARPDAKTPHIISEALKQHT